MRFLKGLIASAAVAIGLGGSAYAGDEEVLAKEFETATIVAACNEIVVIVITTEDNKSYVVDRNSGIPADAIKRAIAASDAQVRVYNLACTIPEIRT